MKIVVTRTHTQPAAVGCARPCARISISYRIACQLFILFLAAPGHITPRTAPLSCSDCHHCNHLCVVKHFASCTQNACCASLSLSPSVVLLELLHQFMLLPALTYDTVFFYKEDIHRLRSRVVRVSLFAPLVSVARTLRNFQLLCSAFRMLTLRFRCLPPCSPC